MLKSLFLCCVIGFCLFTGTLTAQDTRGHWFGIGHVQTIGEYNHYLSELVLRQKGKQVTGELQYYFRDSLLTV
ncbi:MAG TPA: hypothetical protein VG842_08465, partial [Sediminibacterium sp.]|nr:hypothetical protein [Sediminibacterium sp.]